MQTGVEHDHILSMCFSKQQVKNGIEDLLKLEHVEGHPLGIILISANSNCKACGGNLKLCSDRPAFLTVYTEDMGTIPAAAYCKYCKNSHKGCTFTQHYGFHCFINQSSS